MVFVVVVFGKVTQKKNSSTAKKKLEFKYFSTTVGESNVWHAGQKWYLLKLLSNLKIKLKQPFLAYIQPTFWLN